MKAKAGSSKRKTRSNFSIEIEKKSKSGGSRIVLALDLDFRRNTSRILSDALSIVRKTCEYLCAVKLNFHLIVPLSISELSKLNKEIQSCGLTSIADIKLNDIDNTNRVATEYLWKAGFSAVIVNPFVGYQNGLDIVLKKAHSIGKGVILLAYMSHKGADEGYGLELKSGGTLQELFLERAKAWDADGVVIGTTRPEKIVEARRFLGADFKIFSPGSGSQGGDPIKSLKAGADYLIFGRSIIESRDPKETVRQIYRSQLALSEKD